MKWFWFIVWKLTKYRVICLSLYSNMMDQSSIIERFTTVKISNRLTFSILSLFSIGINERAFKAFLVFYVASWSFLTVGVGPKFPLF